MIQAELEPQFSLAMQAYLSGRLAEADTYFARITTRWPECIEAWFQRGEIAEQQQNFSAAIGHYEKVLAQNPEVQEVWFRLGSIAAHQHMPQLAIGYWTQALNINPAYTEPHLHLGLLYARSENPLALQHFNQVCQLSHSALPLVTLARTLLWQNQHGVSAQLIAAALAYLTTQPETSELYPQALALAIQIAHEQHQDTLALQWIHEAHLSQEQKDSLEALYLPLNASAEAIQNFQEKLKTQPPSSLPPSLLPRLLAWEKHPVQSALHRYLLPEFTAPPLPAPPSDRTPPFRGVCILHESAVPLWPEYRAYLKTLPRQYWELHLLITHPLPLPLENLNATVHRVSPEEAQTWLSQQPLDLLLHTGVDRQSDALDLALHCRSFTAANIKWTPYSKENLLYDTFDPYFSGEAPCKALHDSPQHTLHLHRWSVLLQQHLRQLYSTR